jgi:tyrosinase
MTLPKEAEVLGANSGELEIKGSGAHTIVKLTAVGQRKVAALISSASAETAANSVYLGLENIRGDFDAAVLTAYINLPEDASPRDHHNLRAEGVGLYGLRRASIRQGNNDGPGMTFLLDISQILVSEFEAKLLNVEEIPVRIVPDHPLPDSIKLVVGRVSIFTTSPSS